MTRAGEETRWWAGTDFASPWFPVGGDEVRLLRDGIEAFPAMLDAIARAEREILLEMYWVGDDAVGQRFRDVLAAKAREGVTVRVIYDAVGSLTITSTFWQPLLDAGGEVRDYHPLSPLRSTFELAHVELRDHRKILVVDGRTGFTGGLNLAQAWLPREDGGEAWRDDMIEVRGRVVQELRTLFYKTWRRVWFRQLPRERVPMNVPRDLARLSRRPSGSVWVLASLRRSRRNVLREYLTRINRATVSIDIANSYFIPSRFVRSALFRAVRRGVRVRVLVPAKSDVAVVQFALEANFDTLLRHGVEVYTMPGRMMHAKTAVIDAFATIGSYNLDERSRAKNLEVNIAVADDAFASYVRTWFERDLEQAKRVVLAEWRERSFVQRGVEYVAFALRKLW
jgi:cardiolipin synthase